MVISLDKQGKKTKQPVPGRFHPSGKKGYVSQKDRPLAFGAIAYVMRNWLRWNRPALPKEYVLTSWPKAPVITNVSTKPRYGHWSWPIPFVHEGGLVTFIELKHKPKRQTDIVINRLYVIPKSAIGSHKVIGRSCGKPTGKVWMDKYCVEDRSGPKGYDRIKLFD